MAKLIVKRSSEWNNRFRTIGIYLNGEKIGDIGNGELKEFELAPGSHQLKSKIDWCGSQELQFDIVQGQTKVVALSGFKYGKYLVPIVLLITLLYSLFGAQWNMDVKYFVMLILPAALYLLYFLSFGRNSYLNLKEIQA